MSESENYFKSPGQYVYDGVIYTVGFDKDVLDRIRDGHFQLRADDVLVSSYPKAGTSWLQSIVSLVCNADDMEEASRLHLDIRVPFLEFTPMGKPPIADKLEAAASPRIMKTHLPARFFDNQPEMLQKRTKTIYVMRNPKDTLVSYFHFYRMNEYFGCYQDSWSDFFDLFKDGHIGLGNWFDMVLEWWSYRHKFNIMFVKYEDLQKEPLTGIQNIAEYLGKDLSLEQLQRLVELTTFSSMSQGPVFSETQGLRQDVSPFLRKGQVGDWKNYFTDEQNAYFDALYERRMADTGLQLDFGI